MRRVLAVAGARQLRWPLVADDWRSGTAAHCRARPIETKRLTKAGVKKCDGPREEGQTWMGGLAARGELVVWGQSAHFRARLVDTSC